MVVMSSMKAETCDQEHRTYLLLTWMEYLLLQLPLVDTKPDFVELYQYLHQSGPKKVCVLIDFIKE